MLIKLLKKGDYVYDEALEKKTIFSGAFFVSDRAGNNLISQGRAEVFRGDLLNDTYSETLKKRYKS